MIQLLTGKTGSGKTQKMIDEMIVHSQQLSADERIILIVPEQATLIMQKAVLMAHPGRCLGSIEVLSFGRLAYRLGDDLAIAGKTMLSDMGKMMLIKQLIQSNPTNYPFLSKHIHKQGYLEALRTLMSEFSRYQVNREAMEKALKQLPEGLLSLKMSESMQLYEAYMQAIEERFLSGESIMERLLSRLQEIKTVKGFHLYIDGFYGFTPIQYHLINKLMQLVKSCHITFTIDQASLKKTRLHESDLYYEAHTTYNRISTMLEEYPMLSVERVHCQGGLENPTFEHLRDHLYHYPYEVAKSEPKGLMRYQCQNMQQELDYMADAISHLVVDEGYRYRDIAVVVPDFSLYERHLRKQLELYKIPYYIDGKKQVASNDGIHFVINLLSIYAYGFRQDHVMALLKSPYWRGDEATIDHLENYILRYNISGFKKWSKPWTYPMPDVHVGREDAYHHHQLELINGLRQEVVDLLDKYQITSKATMTQHMKRLNLLLQAFDLETLLQKRGDDFTERSEHVKAREYYQIYDVLMTLMDQMCQVTLTEELSQLEVLKLFTSATQEMTVGLVPAGIDEVLIGDMVRTRMPNKKVLFVLGMNEGLVPMLKDGKGFISDQERARLEQVGIQLAPSAMSTLYREQFYVYLALLKATKKLYLSHITTNEEGKASRAAHLWHVIGKLFPTNQVRNVGLLYEKRQPNYQLSASYRRLLKALSVERGIDATFLAWLKERPELEGRLSRALRAKQASDLQLSLTKERATQLFGEAITTSVTRLEQFARCPFAHYVTYGLGAKEREAYEISMPQLGMIFHRVIEMFFKRMKERNMPWDEMTESLKDLWVAELVDIALKEEGYEVFYENARNAHHIKRLRDMLSKALWAIRYQILKGDFRPRATEWQFYGDQAALKSIHFNLEGDRQLYLKGVIDRVDTFFDEDMAYVTIVDYKSSSHKVNLDEVYHGLSLQLVIYLNAACELVERELRQPVQPAGIFYFKIDDPMIQIDSEKDLEKVPEEQLKALSLKGIVLEDDAIIKRLDREFAKQSTVIPVGRKKDASLTKNSDTLPAASFKELRDYVHKKVTRLGERLYEGDVGITPSSHNGKLACDYCHYKSICRFDERLPGHAYNEMEALSKDEVMTLLHKEVSPDPSNG